MSTFETGDIVRHKLSGSIGVIDCGNEDSSSVEWRQERPYVEYHYHDGKMYGVTVSVKPRHAWFTDGELEMVEPIAARCPRIVVANEEYDLVVKAARAAVIMQTA